MLVFWTMERSLPSGRRPGPAGRPQRARGRRNRGRRGAASTGSSHLALPAAALFLPPLPPPALSSAAAASSAPGGSASPPAPPRRVPPPLRPPGPAPRSPSAGSARTMAGRPRSGARAGLGLARGEGGPRCGGRGGGRNPPEGWGPGVAVYQGMPSTNGGVTRLSMAGTAPPPSVPNRSS